jgi:hypothetical protein
VHILSKLMPSVRAFGSLYTINKEREALPLTCDEFLTGKTDDVIAKLGNLCADLPAACNTIKASVDSATRAVQESLYASHSSTDK